jgi:hypothetical protein
MKMLNFVFVFQFVGQQSDHHGASLAGSNNNNNNPHHQMDGVLPSPTHSELSNSNNIVPERTAPQTGQILRDIPQTARQRICIIYGRRYKI